MKASEIAAYLGSNLRGEDLQVIGPGMLDSPGPGQMLFVKNYEERHVEHLNSTPGIFALASPEYEGKLRVSHAIVGNPRLAFARALTQFFAPKVSPGIARTAVIAPSVKIGDNVRIGEFCVIEEGVSIGDNTEIRHHVVLSRNVSIGRECLVKSHAVIGEEGFGFDFDENKTPIRIPHLGSVQIGHRVEIGSGTRVARGTIGNTIIENDVKMDDLVFVAHNVRVGKGTILTANAEISGSVIVGKNVWVAPSATITNKVSIGDRAFVGIGAVVTKDVPEGTVVAGNPARRAGAVS